MVNSDLADVGKVAVRQALEELMEWERNCVLVYVPMTGYLKARGRIISTYPSLHSVEE